MIPRAKKALISFLVKRLPYLIWILTWLVLFFIVAYFWIRIEPGQTYGFGSAFLHGWFWFHNWILSWFTGRYVWVPSNTGWGYTTGFVAGVLIPQLINFIIRIIIELWEYQEERRRDHAEAVRTILSRRW